MIFRPLMTSGKADSGLWLDLNPDWHKSLEHPQRELSTPKIKLGIFYFLCEYINYYFLQNNIPIFIVFELKQKVCEHHRVLFPLFYLGSRCTCSSLGGYFQLNLPFSFWSSNYLQFYCLSGKTWDLHHLLTFLFYFPHRSYKHNEEAYLQRSLRSHLQSLVNLHWARRGSRLSFKHIQVIMLVSPAFVCHRPFR